MTFDGWFLKTPLGRFGLVVNDGVVVGSGFAPPREIATRISGAPHEVMMRRDVGEVSRAIVDYFGGEVDALASIPVDQPGGPFHKAVWSALRTIPPGYVITYGQLARKAGRPRAARAAGAACARNLISVIVPCHRAVSSRTGEPLEARLNNYYYGLEIKRWLLEHESRSGPVEP